MTTWEKWWFFAAILNYQKVYTLKLYQLLWSFWSASDLRWAFSSDFFGDSSSLPWAWGTCWMLFHINPNENLCWSQTSSWWSDQGSPPWWKSSIKRYLTTDNPRIWWVATKSKSMFPVDPVLSKDPCYKRNWFTLVSNTYKSSFAIHEMSQLEP